jgi:hypothetical protein
MDLWRHELIVCKKWYKNNLKMRLTAVLFDPPRRAPHLLDFCQLGIEVFLGKGWRANRGSKEAEAGGEFGREGWTHDIYVIWFGGILGDSVSD